MNVDFATVYNMMLRSFSEPREVAEELTSRRLDRGTLWSIMALVVVVSALVVTVSSLVSPPTPELAPLMGTPFLAALVIGASQVVLVFVLYFTGRMMGGTGHFPETIMLIAWHQGMTVFLQIITLAISIVSPLFGGLISLFGAFYLFYVLLQFIDVLHGFKSLAKAFGTFAFGVVGIGLGLAVMLSLIGVSAATVS